MKGIYDDTLSDVIKSAVNRTIECVRSGFPHIGTDLARWIETLSRKVGSPESYFLHREAFPLFFFPWELEKTLTGEVHIERQARMAYGLVNGYYFIRMIDNVMDNENGPERGFLPSLYHFHHEFERPFTELFDATHPFWKTFEQYSRDGIEATIRDHISNPTDETMFRATAGRKAVAGVIPMVAVAQLTGHPKGHEPWVLFLERFACWNQMYNDFFDWVRDLEAGISTYFISVGERQRRSDEPMAAWFHREGFEWGVSLLNTWMKQMQVQAMDLGSQALKRYLEMRAILLKNRTMNMEKGIRDMARLYEVLRGTRQ